MVAFYLLIWSFCIPSLQSNGVAYHMNIRLISFTCRLPLWVQKARGTDQNDSDRLYGIWLSADKLFNILPYHFDGIF